MHEYPSFPITPYLSEIISDLKSSEGHTLILSAETAAGKSTVLPLALMDTFTEDENSLSGKILMTEPRRIAVLGVANRLAYLCNEEVGQSVGYKIHLENKTGQNTKLEVVTEAILVRMLQSDPFLEGYNVVVLDEFHERSVNTDMALAFLKETLEARDDLFVIIMSATMDMEKLKDYLGNNVSVKKVPGSSFPVEVIYDPKSSVEEAVLNELKIKTQGNDSRSILVFLPGISSIRKVEQNLKEVLPSDTELLILHSSITIDEQKKVLSPQACGTDRVILSSSIAETSLTVPGITSVIDSGLARVNRINTATGMTNLFTETETEFSAEQRKGRAGRVQKGRCIRLWNSIEPRIKNMSPEILRTDLSSLVLECSEHGITDLSKMDFLDKPNASSWNQALSLLKTLGLINTDGSITARGRASLTFALDPRLSGIVLSAGLKRFSQIKSLLIKYSQYAQSSKEIQNRFLNEIESRLSKCPDFSLDEKTLPSQLLILEGFPDRLARRISEPGDEKSIYQLASGRKGVLKNPVNNGPQWIVATDTMAGTSYATIFEYESIENSLVEEFLKNRLEKKTVCIFEDGKILKFENLCFGQLVIASKKLVSGKDDLLNAWINEVETKGFEVLPIDDKLKKFILRVKFYRQNVKGESIADFESKLTYEVKEWLSPFMQGVSKLTPEILYNALYWYLEGSAVDEKVPELLILPNKTKAKVKYEVSGSDENMVIKPVIEIIIQRIFGCFTTPEICGKKVLLKLLSPASRPLQITEDLDNFWVTTWPDICKEMKGRYPKHNWDYRLVEQDT